MDSRLQFTDAQWAALSPAERTRVLVQNARLAGPIVRQIDDDGVQELEHQFMPDLPPVSALRFKQWGRVAS